MNEGRQLTTSPTPAAPLSPATFRDVIGRFATGVTVITTRDGDRPFGTTASAVTSLSLEPPMLIACLNRSSSTGEAVRRAGRFGVNILSEDQVDLAARFATKGGDKFAGVPIVEGSDGLPLLEGAIAGIECRVREETLGGTHSIFVGDVERARGTHGPPLAYFRGAFGRLELGQDQQVRETVRERLLSGRLRAGDRLELDSVADDLGVPPSVAFHALARLEREGLLCRAGDAGFAVPAPTLTTALDVFDAIFALWLGAAELALPYATAAQVAELRQLVEALHPDVVKGDMTAFLAARDELLAAFVSLAGSATLDDAWSRIDFPALVAARWTGDREPSAETFEAMYRGFAAVVDAFALRDADRTATAVHDFHAFSRSLIESSFSG